MGYMNMECPNCGSEAITVLPGDILLCLDCGVQFDYLGAII